MSQSRCLLAVFLFSQICFSFTNSGPILYYSFEQDGPIIYNQANETFHATGINTEPAEGIAGKGIRLKGENSYIKTGIIDLKNTDYSYEVWIKPETDMAEGEFYILGPQQWDQMGLKINKNNIRLWHRKGGTWEKGGGSFISISSHYKFQKDKWYQIVGTFSKETGMALYINGNLVSLNLKTVEPSDWHICVIGAGTTYGRTDEKEYCGTLHSFFKGVIDELKIYKRELSAEEIRASYIEKVGFKIVFDGKPVADIIIPEKTTPVVEYSAKELQKYIKKISGVDIPIIKLKSFEKIDTPFKFHIVLGQNNLSKKFGISTDDLKNDGYVLKKSKNLIFICGRDTNVNPNTHHTRWLGSTGTLYGTYRLLEILGVRWFYPDERLDIVPTSESLYLVDDFEIKQNPYFRMRLCWGLDTNWTRKIGYGGDIDAWASGHSFWGTRSGTNWWNLYKDTNPEYFSINKEGKIYPHIAFPHEGVIDRIVEQAQDYFKKGRNYFGVCPNDYFMEICSCSKCQSMVSYERKESGHYSNYVADAVVKVAEKLKQIYPDRYIVYLAYEKYTLPPTSIKKLPENVVSLIAFSTLGRLKDKIDFKDNTVIDEKKYNLIEDWQKLNPNKIYLLEYYTFGDSFIPVFIPRLISQHIKKIKDLSEKENAPKIDGIGIFVDNAHKENFWWYCINHYITAKMLWDPEFDVDEILKDFYDKFFGPASETMKSMFEYIENLYYSNPKRSIYTKEEIERILGYLEKAKIQVQKTAYEKNVQFIDEGLSGIKILKKKLAKQPLQDYRQNLIAHYDFSDSDGRVAINKINPDTNKAIIKNGTIVYDSEIKKKHFTTEIIPMSL
ncbi:MAG: DUF4838 domain-containing protein [Candidatus Omnitrophica bacterium]|nr:DUF4838 domain-containing protein [Candidatus Omnitrophota bacterium]